MMIIITTKAVHTSAVSTIKATNMIATVSYPKRKLPIMHKGILIMLPAFTQAVNHNNCGGNTLAFS